MHRLQQRRLATHERTPTSRCPEQATMSAQLEEIDVTCTYTLRATATLRMG